MGSFCGSSNRLVSSAGYLGLDRTAAALASAGTAQFVVITSKHHFRTFMSAATAAGFSAGKFTNSIIIFYSDNSEQGVLSYDLETILPLTFKLIQELEETFNERGIESVVVNDNQLIHIE